MHIRSPLSLAQEGSSHDLYPSPSLLYTLHYVWRRGEEGAREGQETRVFSSLYSLSSDERVGEWRRVASRERAYWPTVCNSSLEGRGGGIDGEGGSTGNHSISTTSLLFRWSRVVEIQGKEARQSVNTNNKQREERRKKRRGGREPHPMRNERQNKGEVIGRRTVVHCG